MEIKEAINVLVLAVDPLIREIEGHEKWSDCEQGELQVAYYETGKKRLEAYMTVLGEIDPSLSTLEGLKARISEVIGEIGSEDDDYDEPEPSETEKALVSLMGPNHEDVDLGGGNNKILSELSKKDPQSTDGDIFTFYAFRGRVYVIVDGAVDTSFSEFSTEFQEKALELVKKQL